MIRGLRWAGSRRLGIVAVGLLGLSGCGGGGTEVSPPPPAPPPAPVVTSVEVSPASGPLFITDTLQLTATVKDQNGAVMTGKTIAWSSSNAALATVSESGLVIGVGAGSVTISALVEAKTGTAVLNVTDPGPRISTEASTAASGTIGVDGGSITTTSAAGVTYTFIVPAGSLPQPVLIRMTPVTAVRKLPLSGGLVGGVEFQPSGLRFAKPARLRVAILQRPAAGMRLLGLTADGDASVLLPEPALDSGAVASLPILHFSSGLVGFGTTTDVNTLLANSGGVSTAGQFYSNQLLAFSVAGTQNTPAAVQVMRDWFTNVILPLFQNAASDGDLVAAINEYNFWSVDAPTALGFFGPGADPTTYADELAALKPVAALKLGKAIDDNNVVCSNQQSLIALGNVLFWQTQAQALGVATVAFNLDRLSVLAAVCVQIVQKSFNLPPTIDIATQYTLDMTYGVQFRANAAPPQAATFALTLTPTNLTLAPATGNTDASGFFTTRVTAPTSGPVAVSVKACLILPGTTAASDVCGPGQVRALASSGRTIVGDVHISNDTQLRAISDVVEVDGDLLIGGCSTADLHELSRLRIVKGRLFLTDMPNLASLSGIADMTEIGNLSLVFLKGMHRPVLPFGVTDLPEGLYIQGSPVDDLGGFQGLSHIGTGLVLSDLPLTSLAPLSHTLLSGLEIINMPGLTSLAGLKISPVMTNVILDGDPVLTDISALAPVTSLVGGPNICCGDLQLKLGTITSLAPLQNLTLITGVLRIQAGSTVANLAFPQLTTLGGLDVQVNAPCPAAGPAVTISLPALQTIGGDGVFIQAATIGALCPTDVLAPQAIVGGPFQVSGRGPRQITFKTVVNQPSPNTLRSIRVSSPTLISLGFSAPLDVATDFQLIDNALLSVLSTPTGLVHGNLTVTGNPLLSTNAIFHWPLIVSGSRTVSGNGVP